MNSDIQQRLAEIKAKLESQYGDEEAAKIIGFHFQYTRPKDRLFLHINQQLDLLNKRVADIGTGYGHYLALMGEGSYGLDLSASHIEFCQRLGLTVHQRNLVSDNLSDLPKVDVAWSSAVIEHVDSAHVFLRKANILLNDGGTLLLEAPIRPLFPNLYKNLPVLKKLYGEHGDHVTFFTPDILVWNLKRTGFEVESVKCFSIPLVKRFGFSNPFVSNIPPLSLVRDACFIRATKIANWSYPERSIRVPAENEVGYEFKDGVLE